MIKRILSFMLCLVMIISLFGGMGTVTQAKASSMTIAENKLNGTLGFQVSATHDATAKTVTIVLDGTGYQNENEGAINHRIEFTPVLTAMGGGDAGWSEPVYDEDDMVSTIVYTYTNPEALFGAYKIEFDYLKVLYQRAGYSANTLDIAEHWGWSISLLFPMPDSVESGNTMEVQMVKVLDDGSPTEYVLTGDFDFSYNDYNFYKMLLKAEPTFTNTSTPWWGMDYTYEWTLPDGKTSSEQQVNVEEHGSGDYKVKMTATRQSSTEGGWLEAIGYQSSYTAEKTIHVNPRDSYTCDTRWTGDANNNTLEVGKELKFLLSKSYVPNGKLKIYGPSEELLKEQTITESTTVISLIDAVKLTDTGTYSWSYTPNTNLFTEKTGTLELTVNKKNPNPSVSMVGEIPLGIYDGLIKMKADVPGTFKIRSSNTAGTTTVMEEKTYTYTDTELSMNYKDLITTQPPTGDYILYYDFIPAEGYESDYSEKSGSVAYSIMEKCTITIVQANGGTITVNGKTDETLYSNINSTITVTVTPETGEAVSSTVTGITLNGQPIQNVTYNDDGTASAQFTVTEVGKNYEVSATYELRKLALKSGQTYCMDGSTASEQELLDVIYDTEKSSFPDLKNAKIDITYLAYMTFEVEIPGDLSTLKAEAHYKPLSYVNTGTNTSEHAFGDNATELVQVMITLDGKTYKNLTEVKVLHQAHITNQSYETDYTYDMSSIPEPQSSNFIVDSGASEFTFEWYQGESKLSSAPTEVGTYTLKVGAAATGTYSAATLEVPVTISEYSCPSAMLSGVLGDGGWYTSVDLVAPAEHVISLDKATWSKSIPVVQDCEKEYTYYLKQEENGYVSTEKVIMVKRDATAPDGDIKVEENSVKKALNAITFHLFFNQPFNVTINASDAMSDVGSIAYYVSEKTLSEDEVELIQEWTEYTPFDISAEDKKKSVVYVKVTDLAGNVALFGSDVIVFDMIAPTITGVTEGKDYYTTQTFTVTDTNPVEVTINGVSTTDYTLEGNNDTTYILVAKDKAGNSATMTVTMKSLATLLASTGELTEETITLEDKEKLEEVVKLLEEIDNNSNDDYTPEEKEALQQELERIKGLLDMVETVEDVITQIEDAQETVDAMEDGETVPGNKDVVETTVKAKLAYDALEENEKALIGEDIVQKLTEIYEKAVDFAIIEGADGVYTKGDQEGLSFTANGAFALFQEVKVDGIIIDEANYTAKTGGTIIVLKADYLKSLEVGNHTFAVVYKVSGEEYVADCNFTVKEVVTSNSSDDTDGTDNTNTPGGTDNTDGTDNTNTPGGNDDTDGTDDSNTSGKTDGADSASKQDTTPLTNVPSTGDDAYPLAWMILFMVSAVALTTRIMVGVKYKLTK